MVDRSSKETEVKVGRSERRCGEDSTGKTSYLDKYIKETNFRKSDEGSGLSYFRLTDRLRSYEKHQMGLVERSKEKEVRGTGGTRTSVCTVYESMFDDEDDPYGKKE